MLQKRYFLFFLWFLLYDIHASAKELVGVVQYLSGEAKQNFPYEENPLNYKEKIYLQGTVKISEKSYIKIITTNHCIIVSYGESEFFIQEENLWHFKGRAHRIICDQSSFQFSFEGQRLHLHSGEVLLAGKELLLLRGQATIGEKNLTAKIIHEIKRGKVVQTSSLSKDYKAWERDFQFQKPRESIRWKPEQKRPISSRWNIGPINGGSGLKHANSLLNQEDLEIEGFRAQFQIPYKDHSLIFGISEMELSDRRLRGENSQFQLVLGDKIRNSINLTELDIGLRWWHERSWSPFFRLGIGHGKYRIDMDFTNFSIHDSYDHYFIKGSIGIDKEFAFQSGFWSHIGLYLNTEFFLATSIAPGTFRENSNGDFLDPPAEHSNKRGGVTVTGLSVYIAPTLRF